MIESLERLRAKVRPTIWQRPTVAVWNAGAELRTHPDWLAYHLPRLGFEVVCVKVVDGSHRFHGSADLNLAPAFLKPLRKAGLRLTGWGYLYGYDVSAEAKLAAELVREHRLEAFVADCEKEFAYDPFDVSKPGEGGDRYAKSARWLEAWRSAGAPCPLGLSSYGRVDLHRLDWAAWAKAGARFLPQAYACESLELVPAECVKAAGLYWRRPFVHPWVGMYRGALGRPEASSYVEELRAAGTRGFAVYLADTAEVSELRELGRAR